MKTKMLYKIKEVASMFGVVESTLYRLVNNGQINCISVGKSKKILHSEIERFLKNNGSLKLKNPISDSEKRKSPHFKKPELEELDFYDVRQW